jgi:hypothetical protein
MDRRFVVWMTLGIALGAFGGVGATLALSESGETAASNMDPDGERTSADTPPSDDGAPCETQLKRLRRAYMASDRPSDDREAMIEELERLLVKSGGASTVGTPMEFPENLPKSQTPAGFAAVVDELMDECPDLFPDGAQVDCSEFPCMVFAETNRPPRWTAYRSCQAWSKYFGEGMGLRMRPLTGMGEHNEEGHVFSVSMRPALRDDQDDVAKLIEENQGNYDKRIDERNRKYQVEAVVNYNQAACDEQNKGDACFRIGDALSKDDPERSQDYLDRGCQAGDANACNNLAWTKCHDNEECDSEAQELAEQAVELEPNDGRGALDTLAYILCQRGDEAAANEMYRKSCAAGYQQNCTKQCS